MDREKAIHDAKDHLGTHVAWRDWLIKNGEPLSITYYTGDIKHQEECIARYGNILECLTHRYIPIDIIEDSEKYHDEEESVLGHSTSALKTPVNPPAPTRLVPLTKVRS